MFSQKPFRKIKAVGNLFGIAFCFSILSFAVFAQVDPTFAPVPSNTASFTGGHTLQPDGKILVYGSFQIIQGVQKTGIARLNPDFRPD